MTFSIKLSVQKVAKLRLRNFKSQFLDRLAVINFFMCKLILTIAFLSLMLISFSQTYQRQTDEDAASFAKRMLKVDELAHPVIETKEWDSARKIIFAFVAVNSQASGHYDENKESCVVGYCFTPVSAGNYKRTLIDTFHEDGGEPVIEAVFFANADNDKVREIAVLVRINQIHRAIGVYGDFYDTYIYDNPDLITPSKQLKLFESLSKKFSCFEGDQANKYYKCKFKDVASVRAALKLMGY